MSKRTCLLKKQNRFLKRLAKSRRVREVDVIHQQVEGETETATCLIRDGGEDWKRIQQFVAERKATYAGQGKPVQWNRQDLYEETEIGRLPQS